MRILIGFVLLMSLPFIGFAQKNNIKQEHNSSLVQILNNIRFYKSYTTKELAISIMVVSNASGSAKQIGNDEVSDKVYIGLSEFDEQPKQVLYSIDDLYASKDFTVKENSNKSITLQFNYGPKLQQTQLKFTINPKDLTMVKL